MKNLIAKISRAATRCLLLAALTAPAMAAEPHPDWTTPIAPFQIADHLYYVGTRDLASYLVTTPQGDILINSNLASSPPLIRASVEELGFRWTDIKVLLNGQAHSDHVGGQAQIQRETHARVMVMDGDARSVETGGRTDFAYGPHPQFAASHVDRVLHDGDTVILGDPANGGVMLTAHKTPGHTRGCTTWTMRLHVPGEPAGKLRDVVILGGVTALSEYRLVATRTQAASYPGIAADFAHTFAVLEGLPCDVFLGAHGVYFDLLPKLARMPREGDAVWIDPRGYRAEVASAKADFEADLAKQRAAAER